MASSSVPPATVPAATVGPGTGFGFASKTKKKHFVQQKVKVLWVAHPLVGDESEVDGDCSLTGPPALVGSYGTSPEGIGGYIHSHRPLDPEEFESH
uniref:Uncharacterized protein n=1 Tax=Callithrix jacchus TaxID=9483 RepID=A0A8I4A3H2_CALJA